MTHLWNSPAETAAQVALVVLSVAICLCAIRLARGPSLPDRVVALDMIATLLVGSLVALGIAESQAEAFRVATVLALINFVGTVGFAVYIRRRAAR